MVPLRRGPAPPSPRDVIDAFVDCHARIRSFLLLARRLTTTSAPAAEVSDAAARVARYFTVALPLHEADEEQSLLPRLMGRDGAIDQALGAMRAEHGEQAPLIRRLIDHCLKLEQSPDSGFATLSTTLDPLESLFARHLAAEEAHIFPAARRLLTEADRQAISAELSARRK